MPVALYGGKSQIIPLELDQFMKLVDNSYNYKSRPKPQDIRCFLDNVMASCESAADENQWSEQIQKHVTSWLNTDSCTAD